MSAVLLDLLTPAIGVALSPVPIIAVVLMLATPRARSNGLAFGIGWMVGIALVTTIGLATFSGTGGDAEGVTTLHSVVILLLGVLLLLAAVKQWRGRPGPGEEPNLPAWMATVDAFTAGRSFGMGALLAGVNPKNIALSVAAAATIAGGGLSGAEQAAVVVVFVVLGSITVAGPVAYYLVASERATGPLGRLKGFMGDHNAAIMTVILLIFGVKLLSDGLAGLIG
jgi:threonine/homoserine/homoserine lactone efflux protein